MDVQVESSGSSPTVTLVGRLDVRTAADVREALHWELDSGLGDLVVDVSDVRVTDATGLGVLVGAHRRAGRAGRRLIIQNARPELCRMLVATRLNRILHTAHTAAV
jgi:anti-anti-sigma factor